MILNRYKLVFEDNFDVDGAPDPKKWTLETGGHGFGNNESQYYTDSEKNAFADSGKLHIRAIKEEYEGNQYTSAKLTTYGKYSMKYGKVEVRAKLPHGKGTWPAIWMLSNAFKEKTQYWPRCGEIDIMEQVGHDPDIIHFSLHSKLYNHIKRTQNTRKVQIERVLDKFCKYEMIWTEDYIEFLVDDHSYYKFYKGQDHQETSHDGWPFDQEFYLIINLAIGGWWGGHIDESIFPVDFIIDYVKIYELA